MELIQAKKEIRVITVEFFNIEKFTCDDCMEVNECIYAFDPYNTNNDCLKYK